MLEPPRWLEHHKSLSVSYGQKRASLAHSIETQSSIYIPIALALLAEALVMAAFLNRFVPTSKYSNQLADCGSNICDSNTVSSALRAAAFAYISSERPESSVSRMASENYYTRLLTQTNAELVKPYLAILDSTLLRSPPRSLRISYLPRPLVQFVMDNPYVRCAGTALHAREAPMHYLPSAYSLYPYCR